ncbi:MAG: protein translocase subunit SecDF [Niastella sp. SCN 39-18]|nr:protein translocase subunit SecDF [Sphingobacteriales bacterium]ODT51769.1 MAG: protein translocase subunit SecDF [Niastella sp. SCN 39-18]OJW10138.1 MAG: protein translocase subunit SecDF [Sphingobacteriales bacterium 39-19]
MKLKGLVWFFTIALLIISVWELSYTWVVRNYENSVRAQAERIVKREAANLPADEREKLVEQKTQHILDSTKDKAIFPLLGTTYQKSKESELNLGLDLQGGISVTMDVSLQGLLKSLSNNSKDSSLLKAIDAATAEKVNSEENFITLFSNAFIRQNGAGKLSSIFAGPGKEVKMNDDDKTVISKIQTIADGAIKQTYKILQKRIDKFGVAQPNINLDANRGIINVELAGIKDPERVRAYLQSSANLQFWEVYRITEIFPALQQADKNLQNYLNGIAANDSVKLHDTLLQHQNVNPFFKVMMPIDVQTDKEGKQYFAAAVGNVMLQDTGKFLNYLQLDAVKSAMPADVKFLFGIEEKSDKGQRFLPVYAIKTQPGTDKAPLEGDAVEEAKQDYDELGRPAIKMQMNPVGTKTWARLTGKNVGRPIAIALDDLVYSAPNVNGVIDGGNSEISGSFTVEQAQDLAQILTSGKLDAPAKIVADQIVGPTLGKEAVRGGLNAFMIAFGIIFILMLLYYNTGGWVANIALILNLLFTLGVLTTLGFTLTAAGIAGLVLTIGMAVDTNVIIFERIKEEIKRGKNYQLAVADGYKKSLAPVLDAHVTSLLTAFILAYFGLGPVLGFATTQIIGLLLSLFCGILVSRLISDVWTNKNRHFNYFTKLSEKIFAHRNIDFVKYRKVAYTISILVVLGGIGALINGFDEGVEFKGGRSFTVSFDKAVKNEDVADDLKAVFGDFPVIKTIGDNKHLSITTSYLKGVDNADEKVQEALFTGLKKVLPPGTTYAQFNAKNFQGRTTVQPSISDDLKRGAIKATLFSIFIIFLYIFLRFRDWRYSLGTIMTLVHDVFVTLIVFSFFKDIMPFPLEIDQHFIAAILTVIGFSMNDTVIVFDRIREYSRDHKDMNKKDLVNAALNHTLSRTIMTSFTVFVTILTLFIFGGEVTRGFAFAMLIGVVTGTYSSIFVGTPVLVDMAKDKPLGAARDVRKKVKAPSL